MRNLTTFSNGKSLILLVWTLFMVAGCTPEKIDRNPDPPPTPKKPEIKLNSVNPKSQNLVYDGSPNPQTTATLDFSVTGNTSAPIVNGLPVPNGLFTSEPILSGNGKKLIIQASNDQGTSSLTVDISVTVGPVMALLTNKRFLTTKLVQDGIPFPSSIEYDDTTTFALDSKVSVHRGSDGYWGTWPISLINNKTVIDGWWVGGTEILKLTADSLVYRTYTQNVPAIEKVRHLVRLEN